MEPQVAVVVVPFLAQGHLNQLLHFSHLISSYGLPVHYVGSSSHNRQAKLRLHGRHPQTPTQIQFHDFPLPPYTPSPPPNPNPSTHFPTHLQPVFEASLHLRPHFFQLLQQLSIKHRRVIVVHDSNVSSVVQDAKNVPHVECYAFISTSAFTTFFGFLWEGISPDKQYPLELDDVPKMIPTMDGCFSLEILKFLIDQINYLGFESGRIINTSRVIEGKYVEVLERQTPMIKYFAIGPLNPVELLKNEEQNDRHICLEWLDKQEKSSVIYVSFGSTTSMNDEQIMELALGLERSGKKFIWVLRRADTSDVFAGGGVVEPELPEGYQERVKNMGIIVTNYWAPRLEILAHPSVGGFMSHCGWNSCMESISMGVPIAALPMHSDQPRNAVLVTDVLRIGILVRDWIDRAKVVKATIIEESIIRLMGDKEMRKRAKELGDVVRGSVAKDGSSRLELDSFISYITR